ncbi:F-box domain [Dillenia turbinata]|uniref:F-box domain n=1 Tax=Dillenia turbinata TaxID=194707 RepID=A0AAN8UHU0_9MAGN
MAGHAEKRGKFTARNWADLPREILVLIARGLSCNNQLRFRGVCKSWRSIGMVEILSLKGLPCLVCFTSVHDGNGGVTSECLISLPMQPSAMRIFHKIDRDDKHKFVGAKVVESKDGWLFCINRYPNFTFLFLFNPFTKETTVLPDLDVVNDHSHCFLYMAASSSPSSHDCIFFASYQSSSHFSINSCCKSDNEWTVYRFPIETPISRVLCAGSTQYCLSLTGDLQAFSMDNRSLTVLGDSISKIFTKIHLFEHNGELFLARFQEKDSIKWKVSQFDRNQEAWMEVKTLETLTIFIGCGYSSESKPVAATGLGKVFEGCICYWEGPSLVLYSFKDGRTRKLRSAYSRAEVYNGYLWFQTPYSS